MEDEVNQMGSVKKLHSKAIAEDYQPHPFFFRQGRGPDESRLVAWSSELEQIKRLFYKLLETFSGKVEVLLKLEKTDDDTGKWDRYYRQINLLELCETVKTSEELIFQDGGAQFSIKSESAGQSITFDEHGVIYIYSSSKGFEDLCKESGFETRLEKLISDTEHWHHIPKDFHALRANFIHKLELQPLSN